MIAQLQKTRMIQLVLLVSVLKILICFREDKMELLNMNLSTQKILVNYVRTIHKTHYVLFSQLEVKELPKLISLDQ